MCPRCGAPKPSRFERACVQLVTWVGWGAIGGGSWVVVGELIKKFIVKA
jgi:hypothetical protein